MPETAAIEAPANTEKKGFSLDQAGAGIWEALKTTPEPVEQVQTPEPEKTTEEQKPAADPPKKEEKKDTPEKKPVVKDKANPLSALKAASKEEPEATATDDDAAIEQEVDEKYTDPKAVAAWGNIKKELKSEKARNQQLARSLAVKDQEIETLKKTTSAPTGSEDYEKLKADFEALKGENALASWRASSEYKEGILAPLQQAYGFIDEVAKEYEIPTSEIQKALAATSRKDRNKILDAALESTDISQSNRLDLHRAIDDAMALEQKRAEGDKNAGELWQAAQQKRNGESEAISKQRLAELQKADKDIQQIFADREVIADLVDSDDGREAFEEASLYLAKANKSPEEEAYHAHAGFWLPVLQAHASKQISELKAKVTSLEQSLAKYSKGGIAAGAGASASLTEDTKKPQLREAGSWVSDVVQAGRR